MSRVRVLVGTKKGAFVLESDGKREKWEVSGPHFAGWEIYHVKGSPADPNRIYASQTSGWFGQIIQRSERRRQDVGDARRRSGEVAGRGWPMGESNKFVYDTSPGDRQAAHHASVVRRHAASVGVQARVAPRAVAHRS